MLRAVIGASLLAHVAGFSSSAPRSRQRVIRQGWFDKKDDEPLNPDPVKQPSVWVGSVAPMKPTKAKVAAARTSTQAAGWKDRKLEKKGTVIDPYTGRVGGGKYGRADYVDVTNQDEAGILPDWLAGFFYDKSVGGPQRDLESIVATQLFFATFILSPVLIYAFFFNN